MAMIRQGLAGRRIAVTGATGFLGTALVERLLRSVPGCRLVLLVRPGRRGAVHRVRHEVFRNDCFDRLRQEWGDAFEATLAERVSTFTGDVAVDGLGLDDDGWAALAECSVAIHSAASVSFDSPLDAAVEVNLLGASRFAAALAEAGSPAHLIAVSTAYVAGARRGDSPEKLLPDTPFAANVDWRAEVTAARRARQDADAESRSVERLAAFHEAARHELGAAGSPLLADKTERLREEWVRHQMVEAGRARARSLGWPDAYAYTKALGERALLDQHGDVPITILRPSIIESALAEPVPGWIRGFRMAEPVIISYARGLLKEFPGIPEGVVDVIPVDMVVAAIIAVAAAGPAPAADGNGGHRPSVYQVASGSRNPLRYRRLVDLVHDYFTDNPLYDSDGQPIVVPKWSFPGRGRVQRQLRRATRTIEAAQKVAASLPIRGRQAQFTATLEERRTTADRALGYVELYGAYAETEAIYRVDRLVALWDTLDDDDRAAFGFDPALIDWDHFVHDVHLPSIVVHARVKTTAGKRTGPTRQERGRRAILSPDRHLAAFDLENTLIASNVVESYSWLATRHLAADERARFTARMLKEAPALLALDRRDRGDFLRHFYRRYEGAPVERIRADAWEMFSRLIITKSFPAGIRRVREHKALGHRTVLITGALDFVVEPLKPLFDEIVCASLSTSADGRTFTGELVEGPPTGEARALVMRAYAEAEGLRLEESVVYADSASDLPMLEAVGHPVAVNPEAKLATIARKRGWHVEQWGKAPGGPRPLVPIGPRPAGAERPFLSDLLPIYGSRGHADGAANRHRSGGAR
ncbi:MAG TPA: HAD-IB family phosphatase [Acidimicrobiales bacterium]|nr:HAD-IB family phosphatase [Acidimicrobiales bacterium]